MAEQGQAGAATPSAATAPLLDQQRHGALIRFTLVDGTLDALTTALRTSLFAWARDPELYAVVLDGRALSSAAPPPLDQPAFEDAVFRLDCFSKPTITLLGADPSAELLALGLAGTHRVLDPAGRIAWTQGRTAMTLPTIVLRAAGRTPTLPAVVMADVALASGLATHTLAAANLEAVIRGLADADPVDPLLDNRHRAPPPASDMTPLPPTDAIRLAAAAAAATDLHTATLARAAPGWTLPTRAELQSLRGR